MAALLPLIILFALAYAVMIRPQQKRARDHQALIQATQVGDEVMTTAGIFGTVTAVEGDVVSVEIAPGTVMRVARAAIGRRMNAELDEYEAGETFDDIDDELGESVADETAAADDTAPSNGDAPPPVAPSPPTEIPPPPPPAPEVPPAPETPPPGVGPSSGEPG
ncbi:MAG: preprotein translocase subunit YajC [Acidimicrobiia bacterium]|nr:preprotein translocase subunit YajC [Acidimicrobiia bacterium]